MNRSEFNEDSNRSIVIALIGLLIVSVATLVMAAFGLSGLITASRNLTISYGRHQQLEALYDHLQNAETAQRGYIITASDHYLQQYQQDVAPVPQETNNLLTVARATRYAPQARELATSADQKMTEMQQVVAVRQSQGMDAAASLVASDNGGRLMEQIGTDVTAIEQRQVDYQNQQRNSAASFGIFTNVVIAIAILVVVTLAALVYWLYRRAILARRELDRAKDEFVSLASHQLRTPATGIKSVLSMLRRGDFGDFNERQRYFMDKAIESNERELGVIDELLNVAKADAGRLILHPSECDIARIIQNIVSEQRRAIEAKNLQLSVMQADEAMPLMADEEKLYMALSNLLDNARKYTPEAGKITISIANQRNMMTIEVADTGIGIDEADALRIFDRFARAGNATASPVEGTGLGLYLARRIAELHNGTIEVDSKKGHGSRFTMILPLRRA